MKVALICVAVSNSFFLTVDLPVYAAAIKRSSEQGCAIRLTGEIKSDDFDEFEKQAIAVGWLNISGEDDVAHSSERALCLDSPGGLYEIGSRIAKYVNDHGISTRIGAGSNCLSSCALIFMAGRSVGAEFDSPSRFLHPKGQLGFHAPYFELEDDASFQGKTVEQIGDLQNKIAADIIRFGSLQYRYSYRRNMSASLFEALFRANRNEVIIVKTIQDLERWNIALYDYKEEYRVTKSGLNQACENFIQWNKDAEAQSVPTVDLRIESPESFSKLQSDGSYISDAGVVTMADIAGEAGLGCVISWHGSMPRSLGICSVDGFTGVTIGDCKNPSIRVPSYYLLAPDTAISILE